MTLFSRTTCEQGEGEELHKQKHVNHNRARNQKKYLLTGILSPQCAREAPSLPLMLPGWEKGGTLRMPFALPLTHPVNL